VSRAASLSILFLTLSGASLSGAVDGVIEINQAKAAAGGINGSLTSDPAGFPVVISQPGTYRLTGPLTAPEFQGAISVSSDDVTLDLNGFRITTELAAAGVDGISAAGRSGTRVSNGTIDGFGGEGIETGELARIENVSVSRSGGVGIRVSHLSVVKGSILKNNGSHGIEAGAVCTISENIVEVSGGAGIYTPNRSIVTGNTVNANTGPGIEVGYASTVDGNVATFNTGNGIRAGDGSTVRENTVRSNSGDGIRADTGCTISENTVGFNAGDGIEVGSSSAVIGNSVSSNTRCGLHVPGSCSVGTCLYSAWAHNVLSGNNGGPSNRQVFSTGLLQMSATGSGDTDDTNVCSGSQLLAGDSCGGGSPNNCP
jgi:parallel beta-helix repeat protein